MNSAFIELAVQFLPVLAGVAFIFVIRRIVVRKDKVTIVTANAPPHLQREQESDRNFESIFDREMHDALLVNGLLGSNRPKAQLRELAFQKLGMAKLSEFMQLQAKANPEGDSGLVLFVRDGKELEQRLLSFGSGSGILLQYLVDYRLDMRFI